MPLLSRRRSTLDLFTAELKARGAERDAVKAKENENDTSNTQHINPSSSLLRPVSAYGFPNTNDPYDQPPESPPLQQPNPATKRFSLMKFRHFSDTQLATRARLQAEREQRPPIPASPSEQALPAIMRTAPTVEFHEERRSKRSRMIPFKRQNSKLGPGTTSPAKAASPDRSLLPWRRSQDSRREGDKRLSVASASAAPMSSLSPQTSPIFNPPRNFSDSDRSSGNRSSMSNSAKAARPGLFSRHSRSKRKSLFPLPVQLPPPQYPDTAPATPRASTSAVSTRSYNGSPAGRNRPSSSLARSHSEAPIPVDGSNAFEPTLIAHSKSTVAFAPRGYPLFRNESSHSMPSTTSSPVSHPRRLGVRDRASTMSTFGRPSDDATPPTPPTLNGSARNSTSTSGRASIGNFLTLGRFRHTGDLNGSSSNSKSNSFAVSRDSFHLPDRQEGETAAKYLERLQESMSKTVIAGVLSKSGDPFFQTVLRSYTRRFKFFGEPIDMSLRKFLLEAELPKETQQVDRVIQAFADRYHECNPGIFLAPDQAYIVAFSLMMLHTDAFNKNNKHKMQKADYIKNTRGQDVSEEVLGCFYDNICYTPFIHFDEDEFDVTGDKLSSHKSKKAKLKGAMGDPTKKTSGPVDPYSLIIDNKLDHLRPMIKDSIAVEDPYTYKTAEMDSAKIQRTFKNTGILQIISARSRPAAFETQATRDNPSEAKPGVVDIQVTKVGILWRKGTKRQKARSPWREWGVILTGAQLYFFKNVSWVKTLMQQHNTHQRTAVPPSPVVFKPPLEEFRPDSSLKIDEAVALLDSSYNRHKHAFTLVREGGEEEIFLADNENEQDDWLSLINYAAAFRSAGVRIRGFIGVNDGDVQPPGLKRLDSSNTVRSAKIARNGQASHQNSMTPQLGRQIMAMRRKQMIEKMAEADIKMADMSKQLESKLRNARHLQILAPIQPRTREVIIHSTSKMSAMLKWIRRDIWRTKCYKEILAMDALEDADDVINQASRLRPLSAIADPGKETNKENEKEKDKEPRTSLQVPSATSPPQTPSSPRHSTKRRTVSQTQSEILDDDIFRTPPESATQIATPSDWRLPPVESNMDRNQRRLSASSAATSDTSARRPSVTQMSSTSSVQDFGRLAASTTPDASMKSNPMTPSISSMKGKDEILTPSLTATTGSSAGRRASDAQIVAAAMTPDSAPTKSKSHRRSLHRTLRQGKHESGSVHKHRKGKESASTIKSEDDILPEGTPGLERREDRFIVHGKQASVITFGSDWTDEKLRMKRQQSHATAESGMTSATSDGSPANIIATGPTTPDGTEMTDTDDNDMSPIGTPAASRTPVATSALSDNSENAANDFFDAPSTYFVIQPQPNVDTPEEAATTIRHIDNDELRHLSAPVPVIVEPSATAGASTSSP